MRTLRSLNLVEFHMFMDVLQKKRRIFTMFTVSAALLVAVSVHAAAPSAGGNTTVVNPSGEGAVSVNEDAVQPESANIRLIVSTLTDTDGGTPSKIRILSVSGGTLWDSGGNAITLGTAGTKLTLSTGRLDLRFRPDAGRDTNASFQYVVVDVQDETMNSSASTATITINPVNDSPVLQTLSGPTGIGLAATYYIEEWDLTGPTYQRIDSRVNFSNNFAVPGFNDENFSVRWSGQIEAPITGNVTFSTQSDDGVRLWVDDTLIIDNWTLHGTTTDTASPMSLVAGEKYNIRMEFYERGGGDVAILQWAYSGQSTQVIPQARLFPATTRPTLNYVNGAASAIVDDAITVADVDSTMIASGAVVITSNYTVAEDSLLFTDQNGITGTYSAGSLQLNGSATLAHYQTALRSVRYANSDATPTTSTRTVTFTVTDASNGQSNSTYRNITFTATNNAPVITTGSSTGVTMDQNSTPQAFALTLSATDAEYQSLTWSISSAASHGTATASGAGDSMDIGYVPDADYNGSDSFVVQVSDGSATDTITVNVTITERNPPVITAVGTGSITTGSAVITWTTDENASTKVSYGLTPSYGTDTAVADTSPRVTSHSMSLSGLLRCTLYYYAVTSTDAASNTATSGGHTFTTAGCTGDATVRTSTGTNIIWNANGSTGSIVLTGSSVSLSVPAGYIATNGTCPTGAQFQLKELDPVPVKAELGAPSGRNTIVSAHDLSAYCPDSTRVTSFDEPLSVTFAYHENDVAGLVESSLGVYRFGSGATAWEELTCTHNTTTNVLSCTTTDFSSFGIFGIPVAAATTDTATVSGGSNGGCRGSNCRSITKTPVSANVTGTSPASVPTCSAEKIPGKNNKLFLSIQSQPVLFQDVPVREWFACPVHTVISEGIFSGYKNKNGELTGLYGPGDMITLGQLAKVATQLAAFPVGAEGSGDAWAAPYVEAASAMKLSAFTHTVQAASPATRGIVLQTLLEVLKIPLTDDEPLYMDVPTGSLYAPVVATATRLGIVSGDDGQNTFRPNAPINRAEVAKMITLALQIAP